MKPINKIPIKRFAPSPDEIKQSNMDKAIKRQSDKGMSGVGWGGEPTYPKPKLQTADMNVRAATPQESLEARTRKSLLTNTLNKFKK
jgi:hypothetical protein